MMTFSPEIGVYRIVHRATGRFYIGSSKHITARFRQHRSGLFSGRHHSRFLQAAWNKYGPDAFEFEVFANCASWDDALDLEQIELDAAKGSHLCMNGAWRARMPVLDPEVMRRARATANASEHYIKTHRDVCRKRNADPDFQKRATAAIRASEKHAEAVRHNASTALQRPDVVAINRAAIASNGKQKRAASALCQQRISDPEFVAKVLAITSKAVIGVHVSTGDELHFPSQSAAARHLGVYSSNISGCCRGEIETVKGYRWRNAGVVP